MNNENTKFNFPFSTKINRFNIDVTNNILEYYSLINNSQLNKKIILYLIMKMIIMILFLVEN